MSRVLPILLNMEMVRAILDGRKSCTRRLVTTRRKDACGFYVTKKSDGTFSGIYEYDENESMFDNPLMPPYQPGDILYVRETWQCWRAHRYEATADIRFRAGGDDVRLQFANGNTDSVNRLDYDTFVHKWFCHNGEWKPSIHMPKEAARIWLKVTDVRVERLQKITEDGCIAEGVYPSRCKECNATFGCDTCPDEGYKEIDDFSEIWNSTIKKSDIDCYGWNANPWVWVIEFERCEKPKGV